MTYTALLSKISEIESRNSFQESTSFGRKQSLSELSDLLEFAKVVVSDASCCDSPGLKIDVERQIINGILGSYRQGYLSKEEALDFAKQCNILFYQNSS